MLKNTIRTYGSVAKFFHWAIFLLVLINVGGFLLEDMPKDYQPMLYNLHKLNGLAILLLMILRMLWAWTNIKPQLPMSLPNWQKLTSRLIHFCLYVVLILMPISGLVGSNAAGKAPHIGDFKFVLPIDQSKELADAAFNVHNTLAYILVGLLTLHILAALYHHFIKRDNVLRRMLPYGG